MGQSPVPPVNIPIPTKIDQNRWCTYPNMGSQNGFDNHSHIDRRNNTQLDRAHTWAIWSCSLDWENYDHLGPPDLRGQNELVPTCFCFVYFSRGTQHPKKGARRAPSWGTQPLSKIAYMFCLPSKTQLAKTNKCILGHFCEHETSSSEVHRSRATTQDPAPLNPAPEIWGGSFFPQHHGFSLSRSSSREVGIRVPTSFRSPFLVGHQKRNG